MPKLELTPQQRTALRAAAHPLHPVVLIGHHGLSDSVLQEIDRSLGAHELIKIRVPGAERPERDAMLAQICEQLSCAPVHHLGKILIIYRPRPAAQHAPEAPMQTRAMRKPSQPHIPKKQAALGATAARKPSRKPSTPQAPAHEGGRWVGPAAKGGKPAAPSRPGNAPARGAAAPAGIPRRRPGGSALSLRPGVRKGRTTRS